MTEPANGGSANAMVVEKIGITEVTIHYGRPAVRGREGKIWGDVVHTGFIRESFGGGEPIPWRAGANEATTIEFSTDVFVEGTKIPEGKYGFFVAYDPKECSLIFSNINDSWGSYFYSDKEDVVRVKVKPVALKQSVERLTYSFSDQTDSSAVVSLAWEKLSIPFKVSVELHKLQMATFQKELKSAKGFEPDAWLQYANYLKDHNTNLDEALKYASSATRSAPSFRSFIAKADILYMLNRDNSADSAIEKAVYYGNPYQLHYYALGKLSKKEHQKAMNLFRMNYEKNKDLYITNLGMVKGYQATGNKKAALEAARKGLSLAKDDRSKKEMEDLIKELEKKGS
jgi:tetratricopeptide (TPR) repeat protein